MENATIPPLNLHLRNEVTLAYITAGELKAITLNSSLVLFEVLEKIAHFGGCVVDLVEKTTDGKFRKLTPESCFALNCYLRETGGFKCWQRANGGGFVHRSRHGWPMLCAHLDLSWQ